MHTATWHRSCLLPTPAAAPVGVTAVGTGMLCTLGFVAMMEYLHMTNMPRDTAVSLYGGVGPEAKRSMCVFAAVGSVCAALCMTVAARLCITRFISAANVCAPRLVHT